MKLLPFSAFAFAFSLSLAFFLPGCATPIPPITESPLTAEEQRLVGTWGTTLQVPAPLTGIPFSKSAVIHFHPDRSSQLTMQTHSLTQPERVQNRRWALAGGMLRETSGMQGTTSRCTFLDDKSFRIDDSTGASYVWRRYSTSPQVRTRWAMEQEETRDLFARQAEAAKRPKTEFEKLMMKPIGEIFPASGTPAGDAFDDYLEDSIRRDRERAENAERAAWSRMRRE